MGLVNKLIHLPIASFWKKYKYPGVPVFRPFFEIAQVGSRKRGEKTGTLSNVRKPNQTECFYLKEDV